MKLTKKNIRTIAHEYARLAIPTWQKWGYTQVPREVPWYESFLAIKEFLVFIAIWVWLVLNLLTDWVISNFYLSPPIWAIVLFVLTLVALPVIQSPIKFIQLLWEKCIPEDEEELNEKQKGMMRLTDDGELEVVEDQDSLQLSDERVEEIKLLANQPRS